MQSHKTGKRQKNPKDLGQSYGSPRMVLSKEQVDKAWLLSTVQHIPMIDIATALNVSVSTLRRSFGYYGYK